MVVRFTKLLGDIITKFGTRQAFADEIGFTAQTLSMKLSGESAWRMDEAERIKDALGIKEEDFYSYFLQK